MDGLTLWANWMLRSMRLAKTSHLTTEAVQRRLISAPVAVVTSPLLCLVERESLTFSIFARDWFTPMQNGLRHWACSRPLNQLVTIAYRALAYLYGRLGDTIPRTITLTSRALFLQRQTARSTKFAASLLALICLQEM